MGMLFGIPVDHALLPPEGIGVRRDVGPELGSNRRPLLGELARPSE